LNIKFSLDISLLEARFRLSLLLAMLLLPEAGWRTPR